MKALLYIVLGLALFSPLVSYAEGDASARVYLGAVSADPHLLEPGAVEVSLALVGYERDRDAGVTASSISAGGLGLRYGLFTKTELEAGFTIYQRSAAAGSSQSGVGDLVLKVNQNLVDADGFALTLSPFVKVPTATGDTGNGEVEGGLLAP